MTYEWVPLLPQFPQLKPNAFRLTHSVKCMCDIKYLYYSLVDGMLVKSNQNQCKVNHTILVSVSWIILFRRWVDLWFRRGGECVWCHMGFILGMVNWLDVSMSNLECQSEIWFASIFDCSGMLSLCMLAWIVYIAKCKQWCVVSGSLYKLGHSSTSICTSTPPQ